MTECLLHNNTKIAEINALYLHIISILFALFKAIFQLFILFILLKLKKGYECSSDGKAAQRHCNGEQLLIAILKLLIHLM